MVFSSLLFLFRFLPIAFLVYYICPQKLKNLAILIFSLFFYSWGEPRYFPIMIASILVDYLVGLGIGRFGENRRLKKLFLACSVVFNLGMLAFFKYSDFLLSNLNNLLGTSIPLLGLTLPIGISFYTFQTMSYSIDVYRGKVQPEHNIIDFGAFVTLFPQLIAGPIVKYSDVSRELKSRKITMDQVQDGIEDFVLGLGKKVLIANNIGALWTDVQALGFGGISTPLAWLGILAYHFQIYFDFSGYSLMAIGLGKMLGFQFPKNFDFPYISKSFTEFWRRWHMTLGSWFREYLYIPLGGNRVSAPRWYFNMFVVWFCTGFWHGADWNFILWGLFFLGFLLLEKKFLLSRLEKSQVFSRIYVLFFLCISWALFSVTDLTQLGVLLAKMFSFTGGSDWLYYLRNYLVTFVLGAVLSTPVIYTRYVKVKTKLPAIRFVVVGVILVSSVAYLVDASYNPFLYFRF